MKRRLVLGFAVTASLCLIALSQAQKPTAAQKKTALSKNLSSLKSKMDKLGSQIRVKRQASDKLAGDIQWADNEMSKLQDKLEETKDRLSSAKSERNRVVRQLAEETRKLSGLKRDVSSRLKGMYMGGSQTLLSVLIGSKSLGDFAARKTLVERVAVRDRTLFAAAAEARDAVKAKKAEQDKVIERIGQLTYAQKNDLMAMAAIKAKKRSLFSQVQKDKSVLEDQYDSLADESKKIEDQIRAYQAKSGGLGGPIFSGKFRAPVNGRITSGFGSRYHPILHRTRMHTGIDFGASTGTPIHAAGSGIVISAGTKGGYGQCVIIDHGGGVSTLYGHCSRIFVTEGQRVTQGQRIAAVGSTGLATGPHLHFEVRINGTPVNPMGHL